MRISTEALVLELSSPFRIAHGTSFERCNALVRLGTGVGEGALPPYYDTSVEDVEAYVSSLNLDPSVLDQPFPVTQIVEQLPPGPPAALAAVDMALHDLWGKSLGQPLFRLFGLDPATSVLSTYALSIPLSEKELRETLDTVSDYPFLKLKLGSGNLEYDEAIVRTARECYSGRLCIDANSAWSVPEALKIIPRLSECDLDFVEQPISYEELDDWHLLRRMLGGSAPPLIADESVRTVDDVIALAGAADGVNLKLSKCGGIHRVRNMIILARSLDMSVMLGCMIESSLALTAAAHLAPLVDYLDLDGLLHLADDPFQGLGFHLGKITVPDVPGIGAIEID